MFTVNKILLETRRVSVGVRLALLHYLELNSRHRNRAVQFYAGRDTHRWSANPVYMWTKESIA